MSAEDVPVVEAWGLDPLYWSFAKLPISVIHTCGSFPDFPDVLCLHGHPVCRVEILGLVVSLERRIDRVCYTIDDGTDVISCVAWLSRPQHDAPSAQDGPASLAVADRPHRRSVHNPLEGSVAERTRVELGDCVSLRGKLSIFRGCRQLTASYIARESDPNIETLWMLNCATLFKHVYSVPFSADAELAKLRPPPQSERPVGSSTLPVVNLLADGAQQQQQQQQQQILMQLPPPSSLASKRPLEPHASTLVASKKPNVN